MLDRIFIVTTIRSPWLPLVKGCKWNLAYSMPLDVLSPISNPLISTFVLSLFPSFPSFFTFFTFPSFPSFPHFQHPLYTGFLFSRNACTPSL